MDWTPPVIWAVAGLGLIALEALVPGLVIMFFGMGALATALAVLLFDLDASRQLIVFAVSSVGFLLGLRGWFRKLFQGRLRDGEEQMARMDTLVGAQAVVTEPIARGGAGRVKLRGTFYAARSETEIAAGEYVRVVGDPNGDHSLLIVEKP